MRRVRGMRGVRRVVVVGRRRREVVRGGVAPVRAPVLAPLRRHHLHQLQEITKESYFTYTNIPLE